MQKNTIAVDEMKAELEEIKVLMDAADETFYVADAELRDADSKKRMFSISHLLFCQAHKATEALLKRPCETKEAE